jgi:subfamily B ATP-binding cassette protein HlyB/CyaB
MDSKLLFSSASYAWGLHAICRLHRIPFAPKSVLRQIPPPYSLSSFQFGAEYVGLNTVLRAAAPGELPLLSLPCLAVLRPKSEAGASAPSEKNRAEAAAHRIGLVLKYETERLYYLADGEEQPKAASLSEFAQEYEGIVLLFERSNEAYTPEDAVDEKKPFGFRWFYPEFLRHKTIWREVLMASFAIQLMALATPLCTQIIIDKVIPHYTTSTLIVVGVALGAFVAFTATMSWIRQYLVVHTGNRIDAVVSAKVFEHLFKLPPRYFELRSTGVLVARLQGVETIREFISGAAVMLALDVPFLLIFFAMMFYYNVPLTLISCALLAAVLVLSIAVTPFLRARINRQFLLGARNQAFLTEYISAMETVKSLQMEPQLRARYGDYLASYLKAGFETRQLANTYSVTAHALEQIMMLAILLYGALLVMEAKGFTIGMLVAFQMFAARLSQPMLHLVGLWQQFQQADVAVRRLGDIMNVPPEPYSVRPAREASESGKVEVRNLTFRYGDTSPYLYRDLNFSIETGACVAIMGPSGSGKSTLAKLLQGFYLPTHGSILIDGVDIRHRSANELRRYFGVVPQETALFSGTVFDNLALANPHADFQDIIRACKLADIHDVIEKLPEGYQTKIGEHGVGLSGGQKQRIAIARALLKRPRILIFDEATASLDEAAGRQLANTVNRLRGKVTMLFIAHQLPRGLHIDRVITLTSA